MSGGLADWVGEHGIAGTTLDPYAPLDDLEPLRDLIGGARVVAIGENQHHIREFYLLRHRLLRFLVERCGFTGYALEAPYTEGQVVDAWVRGSPGTAVEVAAAGVALDLGACQEFHDLLTWLRTYNESAATPVWYAGVDLPGSLGSPRPALDAVAEYLRTVDPSALPLVDRARALVSAYYGSSLEVLERYTTLDSADRDAVTALLSQLLDRLEVLGGHGYERAHATATHHLRGAWRVDLTHRAYSEAGMLAASATRDAFLAESVLRLLAAGGPDTRIVVACHNWHIQRTVVHEDGQRIRPQGYHLAEALGPDYLAIAATGGYGRTTVAGLGSDGPLFRAAPLPLPETGSIEAELADAVAAVTFADLRAARTAVAAPESVRGLRMADYFLDLPVLEAFDAVAYVPRIGPTDYAATGP